LEVSKTTYNAYLILYRNLFKIVEKKTKIPNPFKDLEGYGDKDAQAEKQKRIPYTPQQIEDIHSYLKKRYADKPTSHNYFYYIASVVGVECAFRIEDVIVLRKDCFKDCYISITEKKTQNKLIRKAPATIELLKDYMDKFPNDGEYIFPDFVEKYTRYNGFYTYVWKAILKNVGIDVMGTNKKSPAYSYHCYRHSKASELLRRGYTEQEVQDFLHHSRKEITQQYIDDKSKQTIRRVQADKFYKPVGVGGGTQSTEDTPAKRFYASHRVELAGLTAEDLAELRDLIVAG
jgi:integrase